MSGCLRQKAPSPPSAWSSTGSKTPPSHPAACTSRPSTRLPTHSAAATARARTAFLTLAVESSVPSGCKHLTLVNSVPLLPLLRAPVAASAKRRSTGLTPKWLTRQASREEMK